MGDHKAEADQLIEGGSDGAVLLYNPFGKPIGRPRALDPVAVEWPNSATVRLNRPSSTTLALSSVSRG
jgi:hypothetical protein